MDVLFYGKAMRDKFPDKLMLFQQIARLGRTKRTWTDMGEDVVSWSMDGVPTDSADGDVVSVTYRNFAGLERTEEIPREYVRSAREVQWYAFWRRKGFNTNLWGYSFALIFFVLFIK